MNSTHILLRFILSSQALASQSRNQRNYSILETLYKFIMFNGTYETVIKQCLQDHVVSEWFGKVYASKWNQASVICFVFYTSRRTLANPSVCEVKRRKQRAGSVHIVTDPVLVCLLLSLWTFLPFLLSCGRLGAPHISVYCMDGPLYSCSMDSFKYKLAIRYSVQVAMTKPLCCGDYGKCLRKEGRFYYLRERETDVVFLNVFRAASHEINTWLDSLFVLAILSVSVCVCV